MCNVDKLRSWLKQIKELKEDILFEWDYEEAENLENFFKYIESELYGALERKEQKLKKVYESMLSILF